MTIKDKTASVTSTAPGAMPGWQNAEGIDRFPLFVYPERGKKPKVILHGGGGPET